MRTAGVGPEDGVTEHVDAVERSCDLVAGEV